MFGWRKKSRGDEGLAAISAPVIAIDGPSGSGKGTIARRVASALGFHLHVFREAGRFARHRRDRTKSENS